MKKIIIICVLSLFSMLVSAEVQVRIEPDKVSIDDSFRLVLIQENAQNGVVPDISPLQKDFRILGTERRMNYSIINGQAQSSNEWSVTLKPLKEGELTIPALKVGNEYTKPITIEVSATTMASPTSDNTNSPPNTRLYLSTEVDTKNPYVNQQILYKVSLFYSKRLLDADYQAPQVENALITPLGDQKRYQTQKNGVTYFVEEQRYAIFPQKSGKLTITSPVFVGLIDEFNPERVKAQDKKITVDVQPIPKKFLGKIWLPAKQVKLMEQYENSEPNVIQGNTLIRNVTLEGVGIPSQLLPMLHFSKIEGVNVYPEKGKDKNRLTFGELMGRVEFKVTYLFNQAGKITIPELKLPWFNTETGKEEIATLPAKTFEVMPSNTTPQAETQQVDQPKNQDVARPIKAPTTIPGITPFNWAWIVALFFGCAWILTLLLWALQRRNKNVEKGQYKTALKNLQQACKQSNPQRARDALLKWGRLRWPDALILNLNELSNLSSFAPFNKQVHLLSQVLYKNQEQTVWRGDELWNSVQHMKRTKVKNKENEEILPPMNPS